ncbi:hypothetical protein GBAR_LOCUS19492 [Geodia barretti]|uniref:Death domain-containing protein n=1 Tax=Geodia barretti TaxID=519541 RepID=A0AA35SRK5_GEOBA|nr:hypothetical protein GBAR_LOCUS19492 [Geodia barretti]
MSSDRASMFLLLLVSLSLAQAIWILYINNENPQTGLTIIGRVELNGTTVKCLINGGLSDESDSVSLSVQGPLSKVVNFRAISNASSVTVSWTAPFSLNVTGVDPDIWYSVLIYNVTDDSTAILCTDCINITETHYTFTPDYPSHCHVYNISIVPLNGAGQGESSSITVGGIKFARENITFVNDSKCNVVYNIIGDFNAVTNISFDYGVGRETRNFSGDEGGKVIFTLPAKRKYSASFDVELEYGKMENVSSDYFTTFDTQDFNAEPVDGGIQVTGRYINGSHSRGTFLVIESFSVFFIVLKRNVTDQSLMKKIPMPPSRYTVHAYDIEENGLPNPHPANLDEQTVIIETDNFTESAESTQAMMISIIQNGYNVTINCVHDEDNASFVVIYKAHGNSTLNLRHKNNLPLKIQLNRAETMNYTFAVFKMIKSDEETNDIDERPVISKEIKLVADIPSRTVTKILTIKLPFTTAGPTPKPSLITPEIDGKFVSNVCMYENIHLTGRITSHTFASSRQCCVVDSLQVASLVLPVSSLVAVAVTTTRQRIEQSAVTERSTYATVVPFWLGVRPPVALDSMVQYSQLNIRATDRMAHCPYAELGPAPANRPETKRIDTKTESPYVSIVPQTTNPVTGCGIQSAHKTTLTRALPTVESVISLLMGVAGRWKMIAEGLGFNEDLIDEIYTNNEMNEACLQDCVEQWVARLQPTWEALSVVLSDMGEYALARLAMKKAPPPQPSEMSVSKMATTAQECVCFDAEVVPGAQDDTYSTGDNAIGDNANIDNAEPCLGLKQDTPRCLSCSMLQEENPIISGEELQVIEAGDSGINSCPVQQYSVEEGDQSSVSKTPQEVSADTGIDGGGADQGGEAIMSQSQEGGGTGGEVGEEMVTGVHGRNVPTTNINTDNETNSGNSEDRGGKNNTMLTDDRSSRDGVRPAVVMCPTLQEEIIFCHVETSSESSVVTPTNCVEEEDEGGCFQSFLSSLIFFSLFIHAESEKVFVTMNSEIFIFPKAPCFCFKYTSLFRGNDDENVKNDDEYFVNDVQGVEDSLSKFICPFYISDPNSEADEKDIFPIFKRKGEMKLDEQALLESIGKFYSLYNGDGSSTPTRNYLWLGRPDILQERFAKWMYAGVALGFHGLDKLIDLKATPPWAETQFGCLGLTLTSGKG